MQLEQCIAFPGGSSMAGMQAVVREHDQASEDAGLPLAFGATFPVVA